MFYSFVYAVTNGSAEAVERGLSGGRPKDDGSRLLGLNQHAEYRRVECFICRRQRMCQFCCCCLSRKSKSVFFGLTCAFALVAAPGGVEIIAYGQPDMPLMIVDIGLHTDVAAVCVGVVHHAVKDVVCRQIDRQRLIKEHLIDPDID